MRKPVYLLQISSDVNDIVNMTAMAVMEAQEARLPAATVVEHSTSHN
jgi:hypothetical protein